MKKATGKIACRTSAVQIYSLTSVFKDKLRPTYHGPLDLTATNDSSMCKCELEHGTSMPYNSTIQGTVVYDGTCGICLAAMAYVKRRDVDGKLHLIAYQLAELDHLSSGLTEKEADKAIYFVREDGRRFRGARGVYEMLKRLPGMWGIIGAIMAFFPLDTSSELLYRVFASNRHFVSRTISLRRTFIVTRNETPESR